MKPLLPLLLLASCLFAQTPAPAFEAAAIKPSNQAPGHSSSHSRTGMVVVSNETLRQLIREAYELNDNQIEIPEKWIDAERYDINARALGPAEGEELMKMLQTLLVDRFKLAFHRETRTLPGYALVVSKGGLKIRPVEPGDAHTGSHSNGAHTLMEVEHIPLAEFAARLARPVRAPVVDETGVKGVFSFKLEWTPENLSANAPAGDPDSPSLFTVLQEKLGLKLESRKVPTEIFVIDHAEKPNVD